MDITSTQNEQRLFSLISYTNAQIIAFIDFLESQKKSVQQEIEETKKINMELQEKITDNNETIQSYINQIKERNARISQLEREQ